MPGDTSKRARLESSRKREGRENSEAIKRECTQKKAAAKDRKDRADKAKVDDLLVEREGDSAKMTQLRVLSRRLESDNQRIRAQLVRRDEKDKTKPLKLIAEPDNLGDIDVELIRKHLKLFGGHHDVEWSGYRHDHRQALISGGLNWQKRWSKQDLDRRNTIIHAVESRRPEMKRFANHWGSLFLLKECFNNIYNYQHKLTHNTPTDNSHVSNTVDHNDSPDRDSDDSPDCDDDGPDNDNDDGPDNDNARKATMKIVKAALRRSVERKAAKLRAEAGEQADKRSQLIDEDGTPFNDGETELEELSDEVRKAIERDEIGIPVEPKALTKAAGKLKRARSDDNEAPLKTTPTPTKRALRPVIYLKRGRGGKVVRGGHGGRGGCGSAADAGMSRDATLDPHDDVLSASSGQTSVGSDDD